MTTTLPDAASWGGVMVSAPIIQPLIQVLEAHSSLYDNSIGRGSVIIEGRGAR